jgi:hypothetical protein
MKRSFRLRRALALSALMATLIGVGTTLFSEPSHPPPAALQREAGPVPREPRVERSAPAKAEPLRPAPKRPNTPPQILSATLDRNHVCPGETTFLRVTAEDTEDLDLKYQSATYSPTLGTRLFGFGRWQRYQAASRPGRYELVSTVIDPSGARDAVSLELFVDDCPPRSDFDARELTIMHRELDSQVHEFDLSEAEDKAIQAGKRFELVRWTFGDGATATSGLSVRHLYPIVLDRRYSYYLVQADVAIDGQPQRIEYGLNFYSYAAANLKGGYVALAADVERGDDTGPSIDYVVTFSNPTPYAADAQQFQVVCLDASGLPHGAWREDLALTVPGQTSLEQTLSLDRARCPGGATYELFGEAEGGYKVGGLWSYKLRPSIPAGDVKAARESIRRRYLERTEPDRG